MSELIQFTGTPLPSSRVLIGRGYAAELPAETAALGERPFVVASQRSRAQVPTLGGAVGYFEKIRQHVPLNLSTDATEAYLACQADVVVTVGGGSAIGFGKVIARDTDAPLICIPTTFSGSERTDIWGQTHGGVKTTAHDHRVLPRVVIYDPELLETLPAKEAALSAMNALAHSVEALWLLSCDPWVRLIAAEGMVEIALGLHGLDDVGRKKFAEDHLLYGAFLCGTALAGARTGFHHEVAHILGGRFGLPHSEVHACLLPFSAVLAEQIGLDLTDLTRASTRIAESTPLTFSSAGDLLHQLASLAVGKLPLATLGVEPDQLERVTREVARVQLPNGSDIGQIRATWLLNSAYSGGRP
jgi:maleylacetate reductase